MAKPARKQSAPTLPRTSAFDRADLFVALGLAIATIAIYARVVGHQFISLDDDLYIRDNPMVNRGLTWAGIGWAFTTFHAANWHPITWIAHMIDSQLFGLNAGGHLFVNVVVHAANAVLVFMLFLRTTRQRFASAFIAALFALHPLHVESVAWAAERKDTLATFFGLVSLIAYARYAKAPSRAQYIWIAVTLALGLMCKPILVTWPFVMLLLDYWPLGRIRSQMSEVRDAAFAKATARQAQVSGQPAAPERGGGGWSGVGGLVVEKLPLFGLAAASAVITYIAQSHGGAVRNVVDAPISLRLSNALISYVKYLVLTFWPHDLAVYYPFDLSGIPVDRVFGSVLILAAITVFCVFSVRSRPYLLVGWLWFLGTLVPVIGIVQVGGQAMADRYHYLPSIGLFAAITFGAADLVRTTRLSPVVISIVAGALVAAIGTSTIREINRWRDSVTLFEHALAVTPPNLIIEHNLGLVLGQKGQYDLAAAHFEKALQIKPDFFDGLLNLGITRSKQGQVGDAIRNYESAIRLQPDSSKAHMELGILLAGQNKKEAALQELQQAAQFAPEDSDMRTNLGFMLMRLGKFTEAIDQLHEALRLNPDSAEAHNNLGLALLASGKPRESIPEFERALRLKPAMQIATDNLRRAQAQVHSER